MPDLELQTYQNRKNMKEVENLQTAEAQALNIPDVIGCLREKLEIKAGRLAEPILKQGKNPKDDIDCHKAFLALAHLDEVEHYLINCL